MSHICTHYCDGRFTRMNESRHTSIWYCDSRVTRMISRAHTHTYARTRTHSHSRAGVLPSGFVAQCDHTHAMGYVTYVYPVLRQWEYWCVTWAMSHTCTRYYDSCITLCGMSYVTYVYPVLRGTHMWHNSWVHICDITHVITLCGMSYVTYVYPLLRQTHHTYEWVMSHKYLVLRKSHHTYKWVMSHKYLVPAVIPSYLHINPVAFKIWNKSCPLWT